MLRSRFLAVIALLPAFAMAKSGNHTKVGLAINVGYESVEVTVPTTHTQNRGFLSFLLIVGSPALAFEAELTNGTGKTYGPGTFKDRFGIRYGFPLFTDWLRMEPRMGLEQKYDIYAPYKEVSHFSWSEALNIPYAGVDLRFQVGDLVVLRLAGLSARNSSGSFDYEGSFGIGSAFP